MNIKHIIFDLDDTLYSSSSQMDAAINLKMNECVAEFFNCDLNTAIELRKKNITHHSTTLEWLISSGLTDVEHFFSYVHPKNEADFLPFQAELRPLLQSINCTKSILTNAPKEHALRVLQKLNVYDLFNDITDIRDANLLGKPYKNAYDIALEKSNSLIENTLFLDDMQKYTDGWRMMGGCAILVGDKNGRPLSPDAKALKSFDTIKNGTLYKIKNIYQLPEILNKLENQHE